MKTQPQASLLLTGLILATIAQTSHAQNLCQYSVSGTALPPSNEIPEVISSNSGTVISANFFNSGAISDPTDRTVSVCVQEPGIDGTHITEITTNVGLDDNTAIKAYPEIIIGSKFGNQWETSFRYYKNSPLPLEHQWPVESSEGRLFANLEYVSNVRNLGLPAFTNNLPNISIKLDMDEENVVGAIRDVMLESWFHDTSANESLIGTNVATGNPIVNTLNNIVGEGHPEYPLLNNTLLEMMVHIGALSPTDISGATRNPGRFQLTVRVPDLGQDEDNDGIDDAVDADFTGGPDADNNGQDDTKFLPVTIGDYTYSLWYGTTFLAPLVIFSRETDASGVASMNLSDEGEIALDWNQFLDYTLFNIEALLQQKNQSEIATNATRTLPWIDADSNNSNLFTKIRSNAGAISGLEFGIEPQANNPLDQPYKAIINKYEVSINGTSAGVNATCNGLPVTVTLDAGQTPTPFDDVVLGTANADVITTLNGDDTICAGDGNDIIDSGSGNDWVSAGSGDDHVTTLGGDDTVYGDSGNDTIKTGTGSDYIDGGSGDDDLSGQSGTDHIEGNTGIDAIAGGSGDDTISTGPGATIGSGLWVSGGQGNDTIIGGPDADDLRGSGDHDTIYGGDDNDNILGGAGNDILNGEGGDDNIRGQGSNDILTGGNGNDTLNGGIGDDTIEGGNGNDVLIGAPGTDHILGNAGDDTIKGGSGNDDLSGGPGIDLCNGQSGTNTATDSCETIL